MTLEEMVNVTRGVETESTCAGMTGSVPRLGWPGMCLHDAGNGVRATDLVSSFPSGIHVGATWDRNLTYLRGLYMGKEFKNKGGKFWHPLSLLYSGCNTHASCPCCSEHHAGSQCWSSGP